MREEATTGQASQPIGDKWGEPIDETRKQELGTQLRA